MLHHSQTHSAVDKRKLKCQFHYKEHPSESQEDGNSSYVVHLALLAREDFDNIVTLLQERAGQQWSWIWINLLPLLFVLGFLGN